MSEKEQQFKRIWEKTKDFGRIHFVREIQMQINDNKKKDKLIKQLKKQKADVIKYVKNNIIDYYDEELEESIYQDEISGNEILRILGEIDE